MLSKLRPRKGALDDLIELAQPKRTGRQFVAIDRHLPPEALQGLEVTDIRFNTPVTIR